MGFIEQQTITGEGTILLTDVQGTNLTLINPINLKKYIYFITVGKRTVLASLFGDIWKWIRSPIHLQQSPETIWVCLKIGYTPNEIAI